MRGYDHQGYPADRNRVNGHSQFPISTDIGALTAEVVFAQPTIRDEIVYLAGDTVTYGEVADKLQTVLERPFTKAEWTVPHLKPELAQDPENHIKKYRAVFAEGKGVAWPKRDSFNGRNGIKVTTAE